MNTFKKFLLVIIPILFLGGIVLAANPPLNIYGGGTGASTAQSALTNLLPAQGSANGKCLISNGTVAGWETCSAGSMVYPASGLAKSTGSAWDTSVADNSSNWNTAYGWGDHASAGYLTGVTADSPLSGAGTSASHLTVDLSSKQAASAALTSVAGLEWTSGSPLVKMTAAGTFGLDTTTYLSSESDPQVDTVTSGNFCKGTGTQVSCTDSSTYLTSLSGAVLTDQTSGQTIGATDARLTKLWATDITVTNAISGSVTGNAGTCTAFASNPNDCTGSTVATAIDASGNLTCGITPLVSANIDTVSELNTIITDGDFLTTTGKAADADTLDSHDTSYFQTALTYPVTGVASPTAGYLTKWGASGNTLADGLKFGTMTDTKYCTYTTADGLVCNSEGGSMTYPGAGIAVSNGSAWTTSLSTDGSGDCTSGAVCLGDHTHSGYQAADADLTTWAGITPGANVGTFLATPSSANLASAVTDETGSGALVFGTSPAFTTQISTPSIITASGALGITPAAGSNLNLSLSTTGDFAVNTNQLYVDTSAAKVGIGTTVPNSPLTVSSASSLGVLSLSTVALGSTSGGGVITAANAQPTDADQRLGSYFLGANDGTGYNPLSIAGFSEEAWNAGARGSYMTFNTTAAGGVSRTEKMRISSAGAVTIANLAGTGSRCLHADANGVLSATAGDCGVASGDVTDVGDCSSGACLDGTSDGGTYISFYDADGATKLQTGDTGGAVTLTLPASTGTLALTSSNITGSAASLSISGQTGLLTFTGLASTNRAKTVRDAADTILELGGSYTPTGTWNWTSATATWPTFNQNTSGTAAGLSAVLGPALGGTGVANNAANTITFTGNYGLGLTLSGATSLTLPTSGTLATLAGAESLTNKKLGSLTSNGFVKTSGSDGTLSVDTSTYLTGNQSITLSGDISGTGATSITTTIGNDKILESMLKAVDSASDEECLTYEQTTGDFEWQSCSTGIASTDIDTSAELYAILTDETGSASGSPLAVFNANPTLTGATFAGIIADNDDMVFEADADNDGSNKFSFTDGASAEIASITEAGLLTVADDIVITGSDLSLGIAGMKLTGDGDGALTLLGLGNGYDEDLTFNLDDVENTLTLSSSTGLSSIDFGTLALDIDEGKLADSTVVSADIKDNTLTASDMADSLDFGGDTSFEIPNGSSPTVDAAGEVAVDTTSDQLIYYGGSKRVIPNTFSKCAYIESLAATDDNKYVFNTQVGITVTEVWCSCYGTCSTGATFALEDDAGNAMTHTGPTCDTGGGTATHQDVTSGNTISAFEGFGFDVTNTPTASDNYELCVTYTVTAD